MKLKELTPEQMEEAQVKHDAIAPAAGLGLYKAFDEDPTTLVIALATVVATAVFAMGLEVGSVGRMHKIIYDETLTRAREIQERKELLDAKDGKPN